MQHRRINYYIDGEEYCVNRYKSCLDSYMKEDSYWFNKERNKIISYMSRSEIDKTEDDSHG